MTPLRHTHKIVDAPRPSTDDTATARSPEGAAAPEALAIPVPIPDLATWYHCGDRIAVTWDDLREVLAVLACCDAALEEANRGYPVEGPPFHALMAQIARVRGMLHTVARRFDEGDVLPDASGDDGSSQGQGHAPPRA